MCESFRNLLLHQFPILVTKRLKDEYILTQTSQEIPDHSIQDFFCEDNFRLGFFHRRKFCHI